MEQNGVAIREVTGFVDDLKDAVNKRIKISADFDKICICGMGGSAIGGDIIKDMVDDKSAVPIFVVKFMDIPHWVNEKTLVIVCSYSGNTRETLSMYDQAMTRNCKVIVITTGGKLMEKCQADGNYMIKTIDTLCGRSDDAGSRRGRNQGEIVRDPKRGVASYLRFVSVEHLRTEIDLIFA